MIYIQSTGKILSDSGLLFGIGYSGNGEGKNNPSMQSIKDIGPIPKGKYLIGTPYHSEHTGYFTISLEPDKDNKMFGRSDFRIHGDLINNPGNASHGCIILSRKIREQISASTDKTLTVI